MDKKIWSILILIIGVIGIWASVIIFLVQDGSTSIDRHAYSDKVFTVKEEFPINLHLESNETKGEKAENVESAIDLTYIVAKEESKKVSIDKILAVINKENKE